MPERNRPTLEGRELGGHFARFADAEDAAMRARAGAAPERCGTCAFRGGTIPNGCGGTLLDALRCILEDTPFYCHERPHQGERLCGGYLLLRDGEAQKAPWDHWFTTDGSDV